MNRNLWLILIAVFFLFSAQTMISILLPLAGAAAMMQEANIGLLVAIPLALGLVTDIPFGTASDAFGRRPALVVGGVVGGLAAAVLAAGSGTGLLFLSSILWGLTLSLTTGSALAYITEAVASQKQPRIQGINGAIQGLSSLVGAIAAGAIAAILGIHGAALSSAVPMVGIILVGILITERSRLRPPLKVRHPLKLLFRPYAQLPRLWAKRPIWIAAVASSLFSLQFLVVGNAFVPVFLVGREGYSPAVAGLLLASRSLVAAGFSLSTGMVVAKIGIVPAIVVPNVIGIVGMGLVPVLVGSPLVVVAFALQGLGIAFAPATVNLMVASATNESERAFGFSVTMFLARPISMGLPVLLGVSAAVRGYSGLFAIAVVLGIAMVATIVILSRGASMGDSQAWA